MTHIGIDTRGAVRRPPYGLQGGRPGGCGRNTVIRAARTTAISGRAFIHLVEAGDRLRIESPGAVGGDGQPS